MRPRSSRRRTSRPPPQPDSLKSALSLLAATLDSTTEGILVVDLHGNLVSYNRRYAEMWGLPSRPPRDRASRIRLVLEQLCDPEGFRTSVRGLFDHPSATCQDEIALKDGRVFQRNSQPQRSGRKIVGRVFRFRDITAPRRVEASLRRALEWQQALFEQSRDAIFVSDPTSRFVTLNSAAAVLTGYSRTELLHMAIPDLHEPQDLVAYQSYHDGIMAGEERITEALVRRKDGSKVPVEFNNRRILIDGKPYMHTVARDISERKRVAEALQASEVRYRNIVDASPVGIYKATRDGRFLLVNPALATMLGYPTPESLKEQPVEAVYADPSERERLIAHYQVDPPPPEGVEVEWKRRDGVRIWIQLRVRKIRDAQGRIIAFEGFAQDTTVQRAALDELRRGRERLRTLSQQLIEAQESERRRIARGLHDDLGQLLTAIQLNLEGVAPPAGAAARLRESMQLINQAIEDVRTLALDLRPSLLDDLGLIPALQWYLRGHAERAGYDVCFEPPAAPRRFPEGVETVCFRVMQEALTNVDRHAAARRVQVTLRDEGRRLAMLVEDDGVGFDSAIALHPPVPGGSLGLLTMQERVRMAGGDIAVESVPGSGTRVAFWLPLPAPEPAASPPGGSRT